MTDTIAPSRGSSATGTPPRGAPRRDPAARTERPGRRSRPDGAEDPRIARRREDVASIARRRRRRVIIGAVAAAGLVAAVVVTLRSPLLDVDRVVVAGADSADRAAVARASGIRRGDALVDVDLGAARQAVMALPDVASATVEREWPGTVRIKVWSEVPLAAVAVDGTGWVIGRGGRVLERAGSVDTTAGSGSSRPSTDGLPLVSVAAGVVGADALRVGHDVPAGLADVVVVVEQLPGRVRDRLGAIEVAADGTLSLVLDDAAGTVAFGRTEQVPAKLLAIDSVLAGVDLKCLDVLDVTEPTQPTISRRGGCQPDPPTVSTPTTTQPKRSATTTTTPTTGTGRG